MSCVGPSLTITTSNDASPVSPCPTSDGDIIISSEASESISINGVGAITGDLRCTNASQLTSISADRLTTIGVKFDLEGLTTLSTLAFSGLNRMNVMHWIDLLALQSLNFGYGVTEVNEVYISNTGLTDLTGIDLMAVGLLNVNNNRYLETINMNNLANVTQGIVLGANGLNLEVDFPNMASAASLSFFNFTSLIMPSLVQVQGSIEIWNYRMGSLSLLKLASSGNLITIADSPTFQNLSLPVLEQIGGGLFLVNDSKLETISFDELVTVDGDLDFYGLFNTVSFNNLHNVTSSVYVFSSGGDGELCDFFDNEKINRVIKGDMTCDVDSLLASISPNNGSSSSTSLKTIAGVVIGAITVLTIIGIVIFFLRHRKKKKS